jgi:hypothetical protein
MRQQELRQDPLAREEDKLLKEEERIRQVYVKQVGSEAGLRFRLRRSFWVSSFIDISLAEEDKLLKEEERLAVMLVSKAEPAMLGGTAAGWM